MVLSFCVECKTHEEFFPSPRETGPSPSYKGHSPQTQLDAMTGVCGRDMQKKKFPTVLDAITIWLVVLPILKNISQREG
jgi:hypothetical protein